MIVLFLIASSLVIVESANAQTIPKPSVPEFTVNLIDSSYDTQPTTTTDPYTGKNITVSSGYHVESKKIEVTVKNQPFVSYLDASGNYTSLYYIFRYKGHYENEWQYYNQDPFQGNSPPISPFEYDARSWPYINASSSDYTTILLPKQLKDAPVGGQIDVQVQALIGHDNKYTWGEGRLSYTAYYFVGSSSDWSSTQTITIPETLPLPSASPTITSEVTSTPSASPLTSPTQAPTQTPSYTLTVSPAPSTDPILSADPFLLTLSIASLAVAFAAITISLTVHFRSIRKHNQNK